MFFTVEETNLMCCFDTSSRKRLIAEMKSEPFPEKRTQKYRKKQNESLIFCGMLVHAA